MEDRVRNLRLLIEGSRRLLVLEEEICPQELEAIRRFLAATEAELAQIESQQKKTIAVGERSDATRPAS